VLIKFTTFVLLMCTKMDLTSCSCLQRISLSMLLQPQFQGLRLLLIFFGHFMAYVTVCMEPFEPVHVFFFLVCLFNFSYSVVSLRLFIPTCTHLCTSGHIIMELIVSSNTCEWCQRSLIGPRTKSCDFWRLRRPRKRSMAFIVYCKKSHPLRNFPPK